MSAYYFEGDVLGAKIIGSLTIKQAIFLGARIHTEALHFSEQHNILIFGRYDETIYKLLSEKRASESQGWKPTTTCIEITRDIPNLNETETVRFELVKDTIGAEKLSQVGWFHITGAC